MSKILEISDLSVAYRTPGGDVRAVQDVNLTLNAGEGAGLCGESPEGAVPVVLSSRARGDDACVALV